MPESDLDLLTKAALAAGDIACRFFGDEPRIWDKADDQGPVTGADLAVNEMLQEMLGTARPDYGWLSEESEDSTARLTTKRQFVIDPIDGTRAFIDRKRDWGHSLAIVEDGVVIAGVVRMPIRDQTFAAVLGQGATCNGDTLRVSDITNLDRSKLLVRKRTMRADNWRSGLVPTADTHFRSSLAYRLCLVASGRFDGMIALHDTWEWDIAAGALILSEAGGKTTDRNGEPLRFNKPHPQSRGIIGGGGIHTALVEGLA